MEEIDKSDLAFQKLSEYFDKNGWPMHVDGFKLGQRMYISQDTHKKGWVIAEIERHRGIGCQVYIKGTQMLNYETYAMRYAINLKSGKVEELDERLIDRKFNVDTMVSTDFHNWRIEVERTRKYKITLSTDQYGKDEFKSLKEAKVGINKILLSIDYYYGCDDLSNEEVKSFKETLSNKLYSEVLRQWEKENDNKKPSTKPSPEAPAPNKTKVKKKGIEEVKPKTKNK